MQTLTSAIESASGAVGDGVLALAGVEPLDAGSGAADGGGSAGDPAEALSALIVASLEDDKAEDIVSIDIRGKSSVADRLIVASGRSQRHVGALADHLVRKAKDAGVAQVRVEGLPHCDWVLVDAGDVIVHLFRPEVRSFYNIEKIWLPGDAGRAARAVGA